MVDNTDNPIVNQPASLEQRSLGGMNNSQQTQNFLTALRQSGAGSNNSFMSSGPQQSQQQQQLIDPNSAYANNGSGAGSSYQGLQGQPQMMQSPYASAANSQTNIQAINTKNSSSPIYNPYTNQQQQNPYASAASDQTNIQVNPGILRQPVNYTQNAPNSMGTYNQAYTPAPVQQSNPYAYSQAYNPYTVNMSNNNSVAYAPYTSTQGPVYSALAMSDENIKENIEGADTDTRAFLSALGAHSYEYKDKKHGVGRFVSPMAQELEKTEVGKTAVINTPEGKMVDYGRLGGITMASLSFLNKQDDDMNERIAALETYLKLSKRGK